MRSRFAAVASVLPPRHLRLRLAPRGKAQGWKEYSRGGGPKVHFDAPKTRGEVLISCFFPRGVRSIRDGLLQPVGGFRACVAEFGL